MPSQPRSARLPAAAVVLAATGAASTVLVEVVGTEGDGASAPLTALSALAMWSLLVVQIAFVVVQLPPGGRRAVPVTRHLPDGWLFALTLTLFPAAFWRDLAAQAPVPFGLGWLPGWPVYAAVLLVVARVVQLNVHAVVRAARPDGATR